MNAGQTGILLAQDGGRCATQPTAHDIKKAIDDDDEVIWVLSYIVG